LVNARTDRVRKRNKEKLAERRDQRKMKRRKREEVGQKRVGAGG
jgi:hypothetical protein